MKSKMQEPRTFQVDSKLKDEVAQVPGGKNVKLCYQCGVCTSGCPVSTLTGLYKPSWVVRMIVLGIREKIFLGDTIWLCASCYTCQERCPQGVDVADLMLSLRNIAIREGYAPIPESLLEQARSFFETGHVVRVTAGMNKLREELGLAAVEFKPPEEVRSIMRRLGFTKLVGLG